MHRRISVKHGNSILSQQSVCKWIENFKNGRTSINCEEGARPLIEGSSACMACLQQKTFYFWGIKKIV